MTVAMQNENGGGKGRVGREEVLEEEKNKKIKGRRRMTEEKEDEPDNIYHKFNNGFFCRYLQTDLLTKFFVSNY